MGFPDSTDSQAGGQQPQRSRGKQLVISSLPPARNKERSLSVPGGGPCALRSVPLSPSPAVFRWQGVSLQTDPGSCDSLSGSQFHYHRPLPSSFFFYTPVSSLYLSHLPGLPLLPTAPHSNRCAQNFMAAKQTAKQARVAGPHLLTFSWGGKGTLKRTHYPHFQVYKNK